MRVPALAQASDHPHVRSRRGRPGPFVLRHEPLSHPPPHRRRRNACARGNLLAGVSSSVSFTGIPGCAQALLRKPAHELSRSGPRRKRPPHEPQSKVAAVSHGHPIHLRPTAPLAERVLLPGDPGRALALAQSLLARTRACSTTTAASGATPAPRPTASRSRFRPPGIGGPSAVDRPLGADRPGRPPRDPGRHLRRARPRARARRACDRTRLHLRRRHLPGAGHGRARRRRPLADRDPDTRARPQAHVGTVVSVDLFYETSEQRSAHGRLPSRWRRPHCSRLEPAQMSPSPACWRCPTHLRITGARQRIEDHALLAAAETMGAIAATALSE